MVKVIMIFTKRAAFLLQFGASLSGKSGRRKRFFFLSVKERISGDICRFVGTSLVDALWTIDYKVLKQLSQDLKILDMR